MILKKTAYGYRVRWREGTTLRQQTCLAYEAARRLNARKVLRQRGGQRRHQSVDAPDPKIKVKDSAEQWLADLQVQPKTIASYEETVNRYIVKPGVGIGDLQVRAVVGRTSRRCSSRPVSSLDPVFFRAVSSSLFDAATRGRVRDGTPLIDANPCRGIKLSKLFGPVPQQADGQSTIRVMDYPGIIRFLQVAKKHCTRRDYTLFHVLSDCGRRPSEALALQWPDVDLNGRKLHIERAVTLGGAIKGTKSGRSRIVPLTGPVVEAFTAWRQQVLRQRLQKSDFVFGARQTGRPLNVRRVSRQFRDLLRRAKLGRFKLYDLRHTYASQLLHEGIKPVDVAEVLGHKSVVTTLNFYAHRVPGDMGYIAERLTAARQANGDLNR